MTHIFPLVPVSTAPCCFVSAPPTSRDTWWGWWIMLASVTTLCWGDCDGETGAIMPWHWPWVISGDPEVAQSVFVWSSVWMKYPQTFPFYFSERWDELSVLAAVLPMRSDIKILIAALAGVWDRNMVLTLPPPTPAIHISDQGFFHQTDHRRARYQTFILYGEGGRHTMRSKLHTMRTERVKQPV